MCEYCEKSKNMLDFVAIDSGMIQWCGEVKGSDIPNFEYKLGVFIDRGYLRLADVDDCNCVDHGEKIAINFCPMCGEPISREC